MITRATCFFIMPFSEELNYFYQYLKKHIETNYALDVERGDTKRLTRPMLQKIMGQIHRSRLVIADISGANPNVLYEVGLAHAEKKPVLFLTQDKPEDAPVDLRQFDFISYELGDADTDNLIRKLDVALRDELAEQFAGLYEKACSLLDEVNAGMDSSITAVSKDVFHQRIGPIISTQRFSTTENEIAFAESLLPIIVHDSTNMQVIRVLAAWMDERFD